MKGECTLKGIEIKNFRSLKDTGMLNLSPITVLVGENSSGKSTFLRAFPLIKQSISKRTSGPLLWAGDIDDYVDFGSFEETVTNDGSDVMLFRYSFPLVYNNERSYFAIRSVSDELQEPFDVEYQLTIASQKGKDFVSDVEIRLNNTLAKINLVNTTILVDNHLILPPSGIDDDTIELTAESGKTIRLRGLLSSKSISSSIFGFVLPSLSSTWKELIRHFFDEDDSREFAYELTFFRESIMIVGELLCQGKSISESISTIRRRTSEGNYYPNIGLRAGKIITALKKEHEEERIKHKALIKLCFIYAAFSQIEEYVKTYFSQVHYIAPLRATAERYYRLRNLAVDEVDYQGKNLAIYLNSMTPSRLSNFNKWTYEYFGFKITTKKDKGHLSLKIFVEDMKNSINLSDTGFGYSQILPIITQLWELASRRTDNPSNKQIPLVIAIEQPELHLHPAVQAKLANAFIASIRLAEENGYRLQLILETHSETIINHFGKAIAKSMLSPDDISVILFEKQLCDKLTTVTPSGFDEHGYMLDSWPYGFFAPGE